MFAMHPLSVTLLALFDALAIEYCNNAMPEAKRLIEQISMIPISIIILKVLRAPNSAHVIKHILRKRALSEN
jgi:hypothetical protein